MAPQSADRPNYSLEDISSTLYYWILQEIPDINWDALGSSCEYCHAPLSWAQILRAETPRVRENCHGCGAHIYAMSSTVGGPSPSELEELSIPGSLDQTWFHTSTNESWAETVARAQSGRLLVHAGSRLAAFSRADALRRSEGREIYLHSFRLSSTADFSPQLFEDMAKGWPSSLDQLAVASLRLESSEDCGEEDDLQWSTPEPGIRGLAYYNRYEVPGDVSILFNGSLIDLSSVATVELLAGNL